MTSASLHPESGAPTVPGSVRATPATPAAVLVVCCTSLFMVGLDITVVNIGLPSIGRAMGGAVAGQQWTLDSYTVALASLLLLSGTLADRFGRRTVFQVGLAVFILGAWLCSLAPTLQWLIAFRVLQGLGGSMLTPAALGIVTNTFPSPAARARALGFWDATLGISMALGPLAGGLLVDTAGWRGVFWASIPVGLAAIAATAVLVPDSRARNSRRADPVAQFLVFTLVGGLAYAIIEAPAAGWLSPRALALFAVPVTGTVLLVSWERRRADPMIDLRLFRSVPFSSSAACGLLMMCAMTSFLFLITLYLQEVRGFSALHAGLAILPMPAAMAACSPFAGRAVARHGPRIPVSAAGALLTMSSGALARTGTGTSLVYLALVFAAFGAGIGIGGPAITNGVMAGVPQSRAGIASGINSASRQLGQSLGVAIAGAVVTTSLSGAVRSGFLSAARPCWWLMAGCGYAVMLLGAFCVGRPRPFVPVLLPAPPGPAAPPPPLPAAPRPAARRIGRQPGRHRKTS